MRAGKWGSIQVEKGKTITHLLMLVYQLKLWYKSSRHSQGIRCKAVAEALSLVRRLLRSHLILILCANAEGSLRQHQQEEEGMFSPRIKMENYKEKLEMKKSKESFQVEVSNKST